MLDTGHLEGRKENIIFTDIIPLLEQRDKYLLPATPKLVNKSEKVLLWEKNNNSQRKTRLLFIVGLGFFWVAGQGKISN